MAEVIFNSLVQQTNKPYRALSRGLDYWHAGSPICPVVQEVLTQHGYQVPSHRAMQIRLQEIKQSTYTVALTQAIHERLKAWLSPAYHSRLLPIHLFSDGRDIPDPYPNKSTTAQQAYELLLPAVKRLIQWLP